MGMARGFSSAIQNRQYVVRRDLCLVGDGIAQLANAFDRYFDGIAGDYRSNALGSAGCDQVNGFERHDL